MEDFSGGPNDELRHLGDSWSSHSSDGDSIFPKPYEIQKHERAPLNVDTTMSLNNPLLQHNSRTPSNINIQLTKASHMKKGNTYGNLNLDAAKDDDMEEVSRVRSVSGTSHVPSRLEIAVHMESWEHGGVLHVQSPEHGRVLRFQFHVGCLFLSTLNPGSIRVCCNTCTV